MASGWNGVGGRELARALGPAALPMASRIGLELRRRSLSDLVDVSPPDRSPAAIMMYLSTRFAASVLPAPDSPETRMHWSLFWERSAFHAASATAKT